MDGPDEKPTGHLETRFPKRRAKLSSRHQPSLFYLG
jgi:hypothetical protein